MDQADAQESGDRLERSRITRPWVQMEQSANRPAINDGKGRNHQCCEPTSYPTHSTAGGGRHEERGGKDNDGGGIGQ